MTDPEVDRLLHEAADRAVRRRVGVVAGHVDAHGVGAVRGAGRVRHPAGPTPDGRTLFEIGSVTKTFTGLLLALAVVEGELGLETEVADLVPEVAGVGRAGEPIRLGHLATHTSGLSRVFLPVVRGSVETLRGIDPYRNVDEAALLEGVRAERLKRTPGTGRPAYSNTGAGLLGLALARHAGLPFGELVRARVCEPLGMPDTVTRDQRNADQADRTAVGHHRRHTPTAAWPLTGLPGAGALLSTADDLLRYLHAHLVPPDGALGEAVRLATTEHARGIGLSWQLAGAGDEQLVWHNGGTGGFRSIVGFVRGGGEAVVVLTNHARGLDLAGLRLLTALADRG